MRFQIGAALIAAFALAGCMGPEGNPNGQAYATDTSGMIATAPQTMGKDSYDPYAKPSSFTDMDIGSAAITPSPTPPMNLTTQGASTLPSHPGQPPQ